MVTSLLRTSRRLPVSPSKRQRWVMALTLKLPPRDRHLLTSPSPLLPPSPVLATPASLLHVVPKARVLVPHRTQTSRSLAWTLSPDSSSVFPTTAQSFTPRSLSLSETFSVARIKFRCSQTCCPHSCLPGRLIAPPASEVLKGGMVRAFQILAHSRSLTNCHQASNQRTEGCMTNLGSARVSGGWEGHLFSSVTEFTSMSGDGHGVSPTHCCFSPSSEFLCTKPFGFLNGSHGNTRFVVTGKTAHGFGLESESWAEGADGQGVSPPHCVSCNMVPLPSCSRGSWELGNSARHPCNATDTRFPSLYSPVSETKKKKRKEKQSYNANANTSSTGADATLSLSV